VFEQCLNNKQFLIRFMSKEEIDYDEFWEDQDKNEVGKIVDKFSRGYPRQGLKGKYIKVKGKLPGQRWPSKSKKKVASRTSEEQEEYDRLKGLKRRF